MAYTLVLGLKILLMLELGVLLGLEMTKYLSYLKKTQFLRLSQLLESLLKKEFMY